MAKLADNTVLAHPDTGAPATLYAGEDVPGWASGLVGDHLLEGSGDGSYEEQTVEDLKSEIERRNEGRDDADKLSASGKKADLVAALEADDE